MTPLPPARRSLLRACTCAHWRTPSCPLALIHVFTCESYSSTAWSWAWRASDSLWPEASGNNTSSHQNFLRRQSCRQGPEELGDRRAILFPTDESWSLVWPPASPLLYKVALWREALLLENGNWRHGFFLGMHKAFVNFHFLPVNHTETPPWLRQALSHNLQVTGRILSSRTHTSFPHPNCPARHPQWSLCQNAA